MPAGSVELRQRLVEPLASLLNADCVASFLWDETTSAFGHGVSNNSESVSLRDYETKYQFEDPIAPLLHARRYPTLVSEVLTQKELVRTDFFGRFMNTSTMYWGLNLFAHDGHTDVGDLRVWRARKKQNFDKNEIEILRTIYPCIVNAFSSALDWDKDRKARPKNDSAVSKAVVLEESELKRKVRADELTFKNGLSMRELQVAKLVASGVTDKEIAQQLGIAYTTVRTYLSNGLMKIGLSNRKELIRYLAT